MATVLVLWVILEVILLFYYLFTYYYLYFFYLRVGMHLCHIGESACTDLCFHNSNTRLVKAVYGHSMFWDKQTKGDIVLTYVPFYFKL